MNKLQHLCLHGFLAGVLLLFPFYGAQAGWPAAKSVSSAGVQTTGTASKSASPASLKIPLQEEMQYLTASQLAEEENLTAILWVQRSAEFRGLSYQAYNLATMEVDKAIAQRREEEKALRKAKANRNSEKQMNSTQPRDDVHLLQESKKRKPAEQEDNLRPLAVVLDIDDTLICNASLEMYYVEHPEAKANYNAWEHWITQHNELLPGARDFLKNTDKRGIQIFYVTGRGPQDKDITTRFLQKADLPFTDETHLLMNDRSGSKIKQFAKLARRYDIICYLGDNITDFPIGAVRDENEIIYKKEADDNKSVSTATLNDNTAEKSKLIRAENEAAAAPKTEIQNGKPKTKIPLDIKAMLKHDKNAKRNRIIDAHKQSFGTKFILLPNPMYGDWENNLAKKFRRLPAEQRIALRKAAVKSFTYSPHTKS